MEKIYESIIKFTEKPRTLPGLIINLEHHLGRSYSEKTSVRSRFLNSNRIPALKEPTPTALPGAAPAGASTRRTACHLRWVQGCCQQWQDVTAFFRRCLHSSGGPTAQSLKYSCSVFLCS